MLARPRIGSFLRVLVECRVHILPFWLLRLRLEGQRKVMKKVGVKIDPCVSIWIFGFWRVCIFLFGRLVDPRNFQVTIVPAFYTRLRKQSFFP